MNKSAGQIVQAVPLIPGQINKVMIDTQPNPLNVKNIIHCEEDGEILIDFIDGTPNVNYNMVAGMDRALTADVFILSGTFTYA